MTKPHDDLARAVRAFENADTEYRRALNAAEQPRLNKAGTRYACAKHRMFRVRASLTRSLGEG